ncbi:UreD-domain-containing protein [Ramaria rubella]|nr:UreD-domain-containing protein [Ramaria rubella]
MIESPAVVGAERVHGKGRAVLRAFGNETSFSELSYTYPLKLLSPRLPSSGTHPVSIAYILSYGGGLVPGDRMDLDVDIGAGAALVLLTQGSTKVFKMRSDHRLASNKSILSAAGGSVSDTIQRMDVTIGSGGLLLHLVDPVTCFRAASYVQHQTFHLEQEASLIVLDWITAGRMSRGEEWAFAKYHSVNEVWQTGHRCARDAMLLELTRDLSPLPPRTLKDRLAPYGCYATVLMFGPAVARIVTGLAAQYDTISQMQRGDPPDFVWSLSFLDGGCVVRAAGRETEVVKMWLKDALGDVESLVGKEVYSKAFV